MKAITKQWSQKNVNPVWGCLGPEGKGNCWYCYAKASAKYANRHRKVRCKLCDEFVPHPHLDQLDMITPRQSPKIVFVDGHFDWNGVDVKKEWLVPIVEKMRECSQHTYPILSKRPEFYGQYQLSYPENVILGTTVTNEGPDTLPEMAEPFKAKVNMSLKDWGRIDVLRKFKGYRKAVSFEPLLGPLPEDASLEGMDWVIIGALSAGRKLIQPKKLWVKDIVERSQEVGASIFMKNTLREFKRLIQKYPA